MQIFTTEKKFGKKITKYLFERPKFEWGKSTPLPWMPIGRKVTNCQQLKLLDYYVITQKPYY
jgi:hypothetical protein